MDELEPLLVDFTQRLRQDERPSIDDYCKRHPRLATLIRELFPTIETLETLKRKRTTAQRDAAPTPSGAQPGDTVDVRPGGRVTTRNVQSLLQAPEGPDELGRLGGYRILKVLGQGGMGAVLLAEDPKLARRVALKIMLPFMASNPAAVTRFKREARAVAALKHSRIVSIYQIGEDRGIPFLAMEFLQGEALEERLRRDGPLATADIVRIGREVAEGLAAAHACGLIHRDIKPANIFLEGPDASVKLLDFGLACADVDDVHLTQTGLIVGTPTYMSPEQANSGDVDQRSDLFSLGVVLYRMCTGALPFKGRSSMSILSALALHTPPPPAQVNRRIPTPLSDLIMRLLAKVPADRVASAQAVVAALQALAMDCQAAPPQEAPASVLPSRRRRGLVACASVALAVAAVVWITQVDWARPPADQANPIATAPPAAVAPFDADSARAHQVRWAAHLGVPLEINAAIGLKSRLVPPGTFAMGPGLDDTAVAVEGRSRDVTISQPFYAGIHEVTVGQFREFVTATGHQTEAERFGMSDRHVPPAGEFLRGPGATWREPGFAQIDAHPVVHVSWNDASAFCQWLSQQEGYVYRLLSEAEWEYCCRAGTTTRFFWGDDDEGFEGCANFADAAYHRVFSTTKHPTLRGDDGHAFTAPVGSFRSNPFGLYDMHGNVWEWVQDPFVSKYQTTSADKKSDPRQILRGGSWVTMAWYGRASFRDVGSTAAARYDHIGFRVARAIQPRTD
jgi:formylglycine-generating enzyme required for sulfatase activity